MYDLQATVRIPFSDLDGRRDGCENHPKEDELGLLGRGARGSSLPPTPPHPACTDSLSAAGDPGPQTMWRISGRGCGMDGILFISTEGGAEQWSHAASVGLRPTSYGTLESLKARPPRKRRRRKEGVSWPEGMGPAASSRV